MRQRRRPRFGRALGCGLTAAALLAGPAAPAIADPIPGVSAPAAPEVRGAIGTRYAELGGVHGRLGAPLATEQRVGEETWAQQFEHGALYYRPGAGAHPVWGAIGERYAAEGAATGGLGVPTGDEEAIGGTYRQSFTGGQITWRPDTGSLATGAVDAPADTTVIEACVNEARTAAGLAPLRWDDNLAGVAVAWTAQIAEADDLTHNPALAEQSGAGTVAENVGWGDTRPEMGRALCRLWLESPTHRENILNPDLTRTGIATMTHRGGTWSTQVFAD